MHFKLFQYFLPFISPFAVNYNFLNHLERATDICSHLFSSVIFHLESHWFCVIPLLSFLHSFFDPRVYVSVGALIGLSKVRNVLKIINVRFCQAIYISRRCPCKHCGGRLTSTVFHFTKVFYTPPLL